MKRFFSFKKAKKGRSPCAGDSSPSPAGGSQLRQEDPGKPQRAAAAAFGDPAQVLRGFRTRGTEQRDQAQRNQVAKDAKRDNTGGASGEVLSAPEWAEDAGLAYGMPAVDRGAIDASSQEDSISSEAAGSEEPWHTSEEELDFSPKQVEKPNLVQLLNAYLQSKKTSECDGSRLEGLKSPKKSLKQQALSDAKLAKRESGVVWNRDVSQLQGSWRKKRDRRMRKLTVEMRRRRMKRRAKILLR